jgi:hypothetical protein
MNVVRQDIDTKQQLAEFDLIDENIKKLEQSKKAQEDYLKSFVGEFASKAVLVKHLISLLKNVEGSEKILKTFNAIAESAQEAFNSFQYKSTKVCRRKARVESQYQ